MEGGMDAAEVGGELETDSSGTDNSLNGVRINEAGCKFTRLHPERNVPGREPDTLSLAIGRSLRAMAVCLALHLDRGTLQSRPCPSPCLLATVDEGPG